MGHGHTGGHARGIPCGPAGGNRDPSLLGLAGRTCTGRHPHCPDQPGPRQGLVQDWLRPCHTVLAGQEVCPAPGSGSGGGLREPATRHAASLLGHASASCPRRWLTGPGGPRAARRRGLGRALRGSLGPGSRAEPGRVRLAPWAQDTPASLPTGRSCARLSRAWSPAGQCNGKVCPGPQPHKEASLGWAAGCAVKAHVTALPARACPFEASGEWWRRLLSEGPNGSLKTDSKLPG